MSGGIVCCCGVVVACCRLSACVRTFICSRSSPLIFRMLFIFSWLSSWLSVNTFITLSKSATSCSSVFSMPWPWFCARVVLAWSAIWISSCQKSPQSSNPVPAPVCSRLHHCLYSLLYVPVPLITRLLACTKSVLDSEAEMSAQIILTFVNLSCRLTNSSAGSHCAISVSRNSCQLPGFVFPYFLVKYAINTPTVGSSDNVIA